MVSYLAETPKGILMPHLVHLRTDVEVPVPMQQESVTKDRPEGPAHGRRLEDLPELGDGRQHGITESRRRMGHMGADLGGATTYSLVHAVRHTRRQNQVSAAEKVL